MEKQNDNMKYVKLLVYNASCKRRFHLVYEAGSTPLKSVEVKCPHCGIIVFEQTDHPSVIIAREENLIKSPDGSESIIYECKFNS